MSRSLAKFIVPMRDWKTEAGLIVIPEVPLSNTAFWRDIRGKRYLHLSPEVVIERKRWAELTPWEQEEVKVQAVGLSMDRAVLVGRSAARVHGIPVPGRDTEVTVNLPGGNKRPPKKQWPSGVRYLSASIPEGQVRVVNGVRVTSVPRMVVDIARRYGVVQAIVACDAVLSIPGATKQFLSDWFDEFGPVQGIAKARQALELADSRSESPLESWGRAQILTADIPELTSLDVQVEVMGGRYRIDHLLNGTIATELHGDIKYDDSSTGTSAVEQMKRDRERERRLQNEGFTMLHATYRDLVTMRNGESVFVAKVREALRAA